MRIMHVVIMTTLTLLFSESAAGRWEGLYDDTTLNAAFNRYSANIQGMWAADLVGKLPPEERGILAEVRLALPLIGVHKHPFDYYALPGQRLIVIPILSVKFWDDVSTAHAWLMNRKCSEQAIFDYMALLRYGDVETMAGGHLPTPLAALGVPNDALKNAWVYDVSGKTLKSTIFFLMAHEAGHVIYQNRPHQKTSANPVQMQEMQADSYALDVMQRVGVTPQALAFFFMSSSWFDPVPSDFPSIEEYAAYQREVATHPLSAERLSAIADRLETSASEFVKNEPQRLHAEEIVRAAGAAIRQISLGLNDPKLREYQKYRGQHVDLQSLRATCH
jgi:Peptidase family M48